MKTNNVGYDIINYLEEKFPDIKHIFLAHDDYEDIAEKIELIIKEKIEH